MSKPEKRMIVLGLALWSLPLQTNCTTELKGDLAGRPCPCLPGWERQEQGDSCICVLAGTPSAMAGQAGAGGLLAIAGTAGVSTSSCPASTTLYAFDSDPEGFGALYVSPSTLNTTVAWDGATGASGQGSLSVDVDFTSSGQGVLIGRRLTNALDLSGKLLTAQLRLDHDPALTGPYTENQGTASAPAGVKMYVTTGSGARYSSGNRANLVSGGWIPLVFDLKNPSYVASSDASAIELSDVRELGIDVDTGSAGAFAAGALHIDSISLQPGSVPTTLPWNFDCSTEGFNITYMTHGSLAPSFGWNSGALQLTAAFDQPGQEIGVGHGVGTSGLDLRGKTLSAKVRLASGLSTDPLHRGSAKLYVATGAQYLCGVGSPQPLVPGANFVTLTINVDSPSYTCAAAGATYDSGNIKELGLIVSSETGGTYEPATLFIDEVSLAQ